MGIVKFKQKYRIDSTRLANWDYSNDGAYFITLCTNNREYYFGDIVNCELTDTIQSKISMECWLDLPNHYTNCLLDKFVIMPNHVHGVIIIDNDRHKKTGLKPVSTEEKRYPLSEIVRGFKTFSARKINQYQNTPGRPFWQQRYYDHIIRDEDE